MSTNVVFITIAGSYIEFGQVDGGAGGACCEFMELFFVEFHS